jgi:hypothetical protein
MARLFHQHPQAASGRPRTPGRSCFAVETR